MTKKGSAKGAAALRRKQITYDDALALLCPHYDAKNMVLKSEWQNWKKPKVSLPIDEAIDALKSGKGRVKLKDRAWLESQEIYCPYLFARNGIVKAVRSASASDENETLIRDHRRTLKYKREKASKLSKELSRFLNNTKAYQLTPAMQRGTARLNYEICNNALIDCNNLLEKIKSGAEALKSLENIIKSEASRLPTQKTTAYGWETTFVEALGYTWRSLTSQGQEDGKSQFVDFIQRAYESIGGTQLIDWKGQIDRARDRIKSRPEWDGFDRDEKGYVPPGVTVRTISEYLESYEQKGDLWTHDINRLKEMSRSKDHPFQAEAKLLLDRTSEPDFWMQTLTFFGCLGIFMRRNGNPQIKTT